MKKELSTITYHNWLTEIKERVRKSQIKAAVSVNREMLALYWHLGEDIVLNQFDNVYGSGFFDNLSKDLKKEFPDMTGFSSRNLKYFKQFYLFYSPIIENRQQLAADLKNMLFSIPWGHHIEILGKCKEAEVALFYINSTIENGWSRAVLINFIDIKLYETKGKAITNFKELLPSPTSDLAQQTLKNPYNFDFLTLRGNYNERELEDALTTNITNFLLELGSGFSYIGRQQRIEIGEKEFYIDLLFYHLKLRCFVVVELKTGDFMAEYIGKLGLYVSAVNHQFRLSNDNPTIGLLICNSKDALVAQYTLESSNQPIGVSEYQLQNLYPSSIENAIPTIEEIEKGLSDIKQGGEK